MWYSDDWKSFAQFWFLIVIALLIAVMTSLLMEPGDTPILMSALAFSGLLAVMGFGFAGLDNGHVGLTESIRLKNEALTRGVMRLRAEQRKAQLRKARRRFHRRYALRRNNKR